MSKLIIIGAGGLGREVLMTAQRANINVHGFLDDTAELQNKTLNNVKVLDQISNIDNYSQYKFIIAIGSSRARKSVYKSIEKYGLEFQNVIDPTAIIGQTTTLGHGLYIGAYSVITENITIGNHVVIDRSNNIGHDSKIGDFATIAPMSCLSGNVILGNATQIGTGTFIREKLHVGEGTQVGMGSILTKNIPEHKLAFGQPCKIVDDRK